jgi:hypothetical protein
MSFSSMPIELNCHIISFIAQPEKFTNTAIKSCARQLKNISLVNHEFNQICSDKLAVLKKINDLVSKYDMYNAEYENPGKDWSTGNGSREVDPKGNPQLLNALFTGCRLPCAQKKFEVYTPEIEQDIKDIVQLTPQSMNCILGTLRCRTEVPPLAVACFNDNIPLHIVEFLLQRGANPNATLRVNGTSINILADLENNLSAQRFKAIQALFNRYGAV